MSSIWRSILHWIAIILALGVLGIVFSPVHRWQGKFLACHNKLHA